MTGRQWLAVTHVKDVDFDQPAIPILGHFFVFCLVLERILAGKRK